eukprot:gene2986-3555_t
MANSAGCLPDKVEFLKSILNWIDVASILPFYVALFQLAVSQDGGELNGLLFLRVVRLTRVFRVLRLSKQTRPLRVVAMALQASKEAALLFVFQLALATLIFGSSVWLSETNFGGVWDPADHAWHLNDEYALVYYNWQDSATPVALSACALDDAFCQQYCQTSPVASQCNPSLRSVNTTLHMPLPGFAQSCGTGPAANCSIFECNTGCPAGSREALDAAAVVAAYEDAVTAAGQQLPRPLTRFQSIPHSFWWVIVTITTVGYGDVFPMTPLGKCIGVITMLCGILVIAFPIIIIGTKFSEAYVTVSPNELGAAMDRVFRPLHQIYSFHLLGLTGPALQHYHLFGQPHLIGSPHVEPQPQATAHRKVAPAEVLMQPIGGPPIGGQTHLHQIYYDPILRLLAVEGQGIATKILALPEAGVFSAQLQLVLDLPGVQARGQPSSAWSAADLVYATAFPASTVSWTSPNLSKHCKRQFMPTADIAPLSLGTPPPQSSLSLSPAPLLHAWQLWRLALQT